MTLTEFLTARLDEDAARADCCARARREIEAKRAIMRLLSRIGSGPILRALAAVYADHPDYREEWRPA